MREEYTYDTTAGAFVDGLTNFNYGLLMEAIGGFDLNITDVTHIEVPNIVFSRLMGNHEIDIVNLPRPVGQQQLNLEFLFNSIPIFPVKNADTEYETGCFFSTIYLTKNRRKRCQRYLKTREY